MVDASKQYVLVKMSGNYADEFDVEGFMVVSTEYFENAKRELLALDDSEGLHMCFGTNENLTWSDVHELLGELDVTELTLEEAKFFEKHFECFSNSADRIAEYGMSGFLDNISEGEGY